MPLLFMMLFVLIFPVDAFAETILLKSGQEIEAKILEESQDKIVVDIVGVKIKYGRDEIEKIERKGDAATSVPGDVAQSSHGVDPNQDSAGSSGKNLYELALEKFNSDYDETKVSETLKNKNFNDENIVSALYKNQEAINLFKQATMGSNDGFLFGDSREMSLQVDSESMKKMFTRFKFVRLLLASAGQNIEKQQYDQASEDYLTIMRYLKHFSQQKHPLIKDMINMSIALYISNKSIEEYMRKAFPDRKFLRELQEQLQSLVPALNDYLVRLLKDEREEIPKTYALLEDLARQEGMMSPQLFNEPREDALKEIETAIDNILMEINQKKYGPFKKALNDKLEKEKDEPKKSMEEVLNDYNSSPCLKKYGGDDERSRGLFSRLCQASAGKDKESIKEGYIKSVQFQKSGSIIYWYAYMAHLNVLLMEAALKQYSLDQNKFPDSLQELVPQYLTRLPEDPFDDFMPLKYKKKDSGYVIYSIGPDGEDQQGNEAFMLLNSAIDFKHIGGDIVFSY